MLIPTGFWSYTTSDETSAHGRLSQLRTLLAAELQQQVGREPKVNIFQDKFAIPPGHEWDAQIRKALMEASFMIPIITPGFLQSEWCCREIQLFRERESELGVRNLVFPFHYVDISHITGGDSRQCCDPAVLAFLRTRQWTDFRRFRFDDPHSKEVAILLEGLAQGILRALRDAFVEQERAESKRRQDEADAARRVEEKRREQQTISFQEISRELKVEVDTETDIQFSQENIDDKSLNKPNPFDKTIFIYKTLINSVIISAVAISLFLIYIAASSITSIHNNDLMNEIYKSQPERYDVISASHEIAEMYICTNVWNSYVDVSIAVNGVLDTPMLMEATGPVDRDDIMFGENGTTTEFTPNSLVNNVCGSYFISNTENANLKAFISNSFADQQIRGDILKISKAFSENEFKISEEIISMKKNIDVELESLLTKNSKDYNISLKRANIIVTPAISYANKVDASFWEKFRSSSDIASDDIIKNVVKAMGEFEKLGNR